MLFLFKVLVSFMLGAVTAQGSANICCDSTPRLDQLPRMSLTFIGVQIPKFPSFALTQGQDRLYEYAQVYCRKYSRCILCVPWPLRAGEGVELP